MSHLIDFFLNLHLKYGNIYSDIVVIITLGTLTLTSFSFLFRIFPRWIALLISFTALLILLLATYNNWKSLIGFIRVEIYGEPPPISCRTDPACQNIITSAETASVACGAYVRIIDDELTYGKKSSMLPYRPRSLQECIYRTNDLFTSAQNKGQNIPEASMRPIMEMIDAMRRVAQIMVSTRETDIPKSVIIQQRAYDNSIENVRNACRVQINN